MRPKSQIKAVAMAVGWVYSVALAINGLKLDSVTSKILSFTPVIFGLLFTVFDRWVWNWPFVLKFLKRPNLNGTWLGSFDADWVDKDGVRQRSSGPAAMIVKQTFTELSITQVTATSKSYSVLSHVRRIDSGELVVDYQYANTPYVAHRDEMSAHDGSARLVTSHSRPENVAAEYWTDRLSRGSLKFRWISSNRVGNLAAAQALDNESKGE